MKKGKKNFRIILVIVGTGFLSWLIFSLSGIIKLTKPISIIAGQTDWIDVFVGVIGIVVTIILFFLTQKRENTPSPKIEINGGSPQFANGEHSRNIQTTTYNENGDTKN